VVVEFLVSLHSYWRYVVLVAAVIALGVTLARWFGTELIPVSVRRVGALYIMALDIQFLIGLIIWLGEQRYNIPGFFRYEHPTIMLLAVIAAHAGQVMSRKAASETAAARTLAIAVIVSLVLVLVGIPGVVRQP